jgi:hypothetical protein
MDQLRLKPKTLKTCKAGMTRRRAYTRTNGVQVSATCVPKARSQPMTRRMIRCPPGQIARASYIRRLTSRVKREGYLKRTPSGRTIKVRPIKKSIAVPAGCIKNVGQPGLGPTVIGPLRKGQLRKFGYSYKEPEAVRHAALANAIAADGRSTIYHRLNAVAKLTVSGAPRASAIFAADRNWVRLQKH